jgi:proton-translocating NADH-quinone oxidoreductase chain N
MIVDLVGRENSEGITPWVAALGFAVAFGAVLYIWGSRITIFGDMYALDPFSLFFKLLASMAGLIVTLVSIDYLKDRTNAKGEFFSLLTFSVLAMMMMASSSSLLMLYLSIEFLSYMSYLLAGFLRTDKKSNEAAIKYFLYGAITSAVMLYGLSLLYGVTGSLTLTDVAKVLTGTVDNSIRTLGLVSTALVIVGLGFKISLVPFHQWAPDTYEGAPTPVTAFLSVGPKAMGFAVLFRFLLTAIPSLPAYHEQWTNLLSVISILTMTVGNLIALRQTNVKRMLAYSSIAQAGYILVGLVAVNLAGNSPFSGLNGVMIYLFAYLFTNLGAFICVIAVENATGIVTIEDYAGLVKRAPLVAALFIVFFLSLAGIPPTAGFIGKFFVFGAALREGYIVLAAIGVVNSVISVFYYFSVVRAAFFMEPKDHTPIKVSPLVTAMLVVTAVMVFAIALYPQPFFNLAQQSLVMLGAGK